MKYRVTASRGKDLRNRTHLGETFVEAVNPEQAMAIGKAVFRRWRSVRGRFYVEASEYRPEYDLVLRTSGFVREVRGT